MCIHLTIYASIYPLTVLACGSINKIASDVTCNVPSLPVVPCTTTLLPKKDTDITREH